jgi:cytochrome c2
VIGFVGIRSNPRCRDSILVGGRRIEFLGGIFRIMRRPILSAALCLSATLALSAADKKGDPGKGKELFEPCSVCHNADTTEKKIGPGLKGLFKRDKLASGKKVTDANIRARIDEGGNGMPAYKDMLSDEEKANIIAYLKTL